MLNTFAANSAGQNPQFSVS